MKTWLKALAIPLLLAASGSVFATGSSSTTTSSTSTSSSALPPASPGTPTVAQYLSPVSRRTVEPQRADLRKVNVVQKQHARHPAGMQRHAGAVAASGVTAE